MDWSISKVLSTGLRALVAAVALIVHCGLAFSQDIPEDRFRQIYTLNKGAEFYLTRGKFNEGAKYASAAVNYTRLTAAEFGVRPAWLFGASTGMSEGAAAGYLEELSNYGRKYDPSQEPMKFECKGRGDRIKCEEVE